VTSCVDVFKSATSVKSMYMTKIVIENQKNRENRNQRNFFLHKSPSNRWFKNGIHSSLCRADAQRERWHQVTHIATLYVRH